MKKLALLFIRAYQIAISPLFGPSCRYYPTCSQYAVEALEKHGFFKGSFLAVRRVLRCHPFAKGGYDPVPGSCCQNHQQEQSNTDQSKPKPVDI